MKYLYLVLFSVLAGCVELPDDSDSSRPSPEEDPSNIIGPKPDIELVDVDGRFLSSTYRNAILGRSFDENDLSGTWMMISEFYGSTSKYTGGFLERSIINIRGSSNPEASKIWISNDCTYDEFYIDLETKESIQNSHADVDEFYFIDGSYFYYIDTHISTNYEGPYKKVEFIKLSDEQFQIGRLSERIFDEYGDVVVDESNSITCYSESEMLSISEDRIWSESDIDIHSKEYSHVGFHKPVILYGKTYLDDNIYYLNHESTNDLEYRATENEGGEVTLNSSIMHIEGTTRITTESGGIASSRFEINITDMIND